MKRLVDWHVQCFLPEHRSAEDVALQQRRNVAGDERPVVVPGVQHVFHPLGRLSAWPGADRSSRLVVIVRDLDIAPIAQDFRRLVEGTAWIP